MKVVVTGAGGQVGAALVEDLGRRGYDVLATDIIDCAITTVPFRQLDVTDAEAVLRLFADVSPDIVFHLAAILSARGEDSPQCTYSVNQTGTYNVLEAARKCGVQQVMFASTIAVYGPGLPDPTPEDVVLDPMTMYGVTKVSCELLGDYYKRRYGLDFRAVRFPGLISASLPGGGTSDYALFMYVDCLRRGVYEAFCQPHTRIPLMYLPDGVRALIELSMCPREKLTRTAYNIAAFSPTAHELAQAVMASVPGAVITFEPDRARQTILDSWPKSLDDGRARADWNWRPQFDVAGMTEHLIPQIRALLVEQGNSLVAGS